MKILKTKFWATMVAAVLAVFSQPNVFLAKEYYVKGPCGEDFFQVEDSFRSGDLEINIPDLIGQIEKGKVTVDRLIAPRGVVETASLFNEEFLTENVDEGPEELETPVSTIYYGTMTGKLSATNDYVLYPANLDSGDYLQARLTLPNRSEIDYDLLLFNSSLSLIKSSDYVTYINAAGTLEESVGYKATTDEKVYVCVYSVAGGSETEAYTLDYSITTNFVDQDEPDENAKEATVLTLEAEGADVSGKLNSPIDNDWYSFTVIDSPAYNKMRLTISTVSTGSAINASKFELYRNLVTADYYGMQYLGSGIGGGEVSLPAGTYYLRVISTNTFQDFDAINIPAYELSVVPVARVDIVTITEITASQGTFVTYPEGRHYRVDQSKTQLVRIKGSAYYIDEWGAKIPSANAIITGEIEDQQWKEIDRPDMATVYSYAIVNSSGSYKMYFNLMTALGGLSCNSSVSTHRYDMMVVRVSPQDNISISDTDKFYYLKYSYI